MALTPYYDHCGITIYHGDCREILPTLDKVSRGIAIRNGVCRLNKLAATQSPITLAALGILSRGSLNYRVGGQHSEAATMQWKPIFNGDYEVSEAGDVKRIKPGRGAMVGKCLAHPIDSAGYPNISFCVNGKQNQLRLHGVVAQLFLGERPEGMEINHKDGNKPNCAASNLEYVTKSANAQHAHDGGLIRKPGQRKRLTMSDVRAIRKERLAGETQGNIAKSFGIDQGHVSAIVNRKIWKDVS